VRGMANSVSAARLLNGRGAAHQHHRHEGRHVTTTDAPTRALTSMPMPTLTHRHSSGGRRRTLPRQPCYCAAVWRRRPPRSDECASY
jgi:hypothetical protein